MKNLSDAAVGRVITTSIVARWSVGVNGVPQSAHKTRYEADERAVRLNADRGSNPPVYVFPARYIMYTLDGGARVYVQINDIPGPQE